MRHQTQATFSVEVNDIRTVIGEKRKNVGIGLGHQIICLSEEDVVVERMDPIASC